ncbi:hypothetical protein KQX54_001563 [Cotesia glomerata]|uniref:Uncharacterized protein n=1 Tax=Cotesia glomerata TaxID=32391 RepID=A0AAV7HY29_COTGL|nr:hypothetical protein KQX54_001563 [Cotesia glomerata]
MVFIKYGVHKILCPVTMYVDGESNYGFTTFFQWAAVDCSPELKIRERGEKKNMALDAIHVIEERCGFLPPELKLAKAILQMPSPEFEPLRLSNIADIEVLSESPVSMARSISAPTVATFSRDN